MSFDPDNALLLVADDWPLLRRCDVYRLFDEIAEDNWPELFARMIERRPELRAGGEHEIAMLLVNRSAAYVADQPNDPRGYALRVAVLEFAYGLPRGDAQGVADLEFAEAASKGGA